MRMKRLIVMILAILLLIGFACKKAAAEDAVPVVPPVDNSLKFSGLNIGGDSAYLFRAKTLAVGVGVDLATVYDGLITLRGAAVVPDKTDAGNTFIGAGPMINIPKLATKLGGQWTAKVFNPSLGVMPMYNFQSSKFDVGIVVSIIKVNF